MTAWPTALPESERIFLCTVQVLSTNPFSACELKGSKPLRGCKLRPPSHTTRWPKGAGRHMPGRPRMNNVFASAVCHVQYKNMCSMGKFEGCGRLLRCTGSTILQGLSTGGQCCLLFRGARWSLSYRVGCSCRHAIFLMRGLQIELLGEMPLLYALPAIPAGSHGARGGRLVG